MRNGKLKKLLKLWQKNYLISQAQADNILAFMKERQKETFFRLLKWLSIIGVFWLVIGVIGVVIEILSTDLFAEFFEKIGKAYEIYFGIICAIFKKMGIVLSHVGHFILKYILIPIKTYVLIPIKNYIIHPFCIFINKIFGENRYYFYLGTISLFISSLFMFISYKKKPNKAIDNLNLSDEQKNVLKTNWIADTLSCIFLCAVFCLYNMLLIPYDGFYADNKIIPIWNILGAITFVSLAYWLKKNIYLIFGIYFIALSAGMFSGYDFACYWIGASRPIIQIFVAIGLLMIAYITRLRTDIKQLENENSNTYIQEKFISTYNWTGLFLLFIALWITSFWGFELDFDYGNGSTAEIIFANILFIATSVGAMFIGSKTEQKIFFNYGLTFLLIETYTVLFGRLWDELPAGISSLVLGIILIGTAKILQNTYLKKFIKPKQEIVKEPISTISTEIETVEIKKDETKLENKDSE